MGTATAPCPRWYWQDEKREWIPYDEDWSSILEVASQAACDECFIMNGKYKCDLANRVQLPMKPDDKSIFRIIRATWFWQNSRSIWYPYPEDTAEILENSYFKCVFGVKIALNLENVYVILEGANGLGRQYVDGNDTFYQRVRRGYEGRTIPRAELGMQEVLGTGADAADRRRSNESGGSVVRTKTAFLDSTWPPVLKGSIWREGIVLCKNEFGNFKKTRNIMLYSEFLNVMNRKSKSLDRIVLRTVTDVVGPEMVRSLYQFRIVTTNKTYTYATNSANDVELWVKTIKWVMKNGERVEKEMNAKASADDARGEGEGRVRQAQSDTKLEDDRRMQLSEANRMRSPSVEGYNMGVPSVISGGDSYLGAIPSYTDYSDNMHFYGSSGGDLMRSDLGSAYSRQYPTGIVGPSGNTPNGIYPRMSGYIQYSQQQPPSGQIVRNLSQLQLPIPNQQQQNYRAIESQQQPANFLLPPTVLPYSYDARNAGNRYSQPPNFQYDNSNMGPGGYYR